MEEDDVIHNEQLSDTPRLGVLFELTIYLLNGNSDRWYRSM